MDYETGTIIKQLWVRVDSLCRNFCCTVRTCLGISPAGDPSLVLNQQGNWVSSSSNESWNLTGNAGTDPTVNFVGTTDATGLYVAANMQFSGGNPAPTTPYLAFQPAIPSIQDGIIVITNPDITNDTQQSITMASNTNSVRLGISNFDGSTFYTKYYFTPTGAQFEVPGGVLFFNATPTGNTSGVELQVNPSNIVSSSPSAALDVVSTTQGVLFPRMTTTEKNAIVSPEEGLMVYDLTLHVPYYYNGSIWVAF